MDMVNKLKLSTSGCVFYINYHYVINEINIIEFKSKYENFPRESQAGVNSLTFKTPLLRLI